eukprot:m.19856 g.19856  ORF g.19856 m.19856 type:complete len:57 (-) comp10964_c0_seq7:164-334(-)
MVVITSIIVVHEFIIIGINQASGDTKAQHKREQRRWKRQSMGSGLRMNLSSSAVES